MGIDSGGTETDSSAYLSWVEVDIGAIRDNYHLLRKHVGFDVELFPVVKADAYGHGAVQVARMLAEEGASRLCVARVEEAVELRENGIDTDILVFAPPLPPQALVAAQYGLEIVVCDLVHIDAVARAQAETGRRVPVHVKADVGMGRLGVRPDEVVSMLNVCRERNLSVRGVMSHFPCADSLDRSATLAMAGNFEGIVDAVKTSGAAPDALFHVSNSAAAIRFPEARFNAVRVGISLYGQYPSAEMEREIKLRPAMNLKSRIVFLKDVRAGTPVSYCHTYTMKRDSRLATLALGYADGYPRHASNHTEFLLHGRLAPQVGRVCMDQLLIDVTDIPEVAIGDVALAFGSDGSKELRAEDVAAKFDTIGYELTTRIGKRLPRIFLENDAHGNDTNA